MSFFNDVFGLLYWLITQVFFSFYNLFYAITHPLSWLNWSDKEALMKFIYYGGSQELFFVFLTLFLFITLIGNFYHKILWFFVRILEKFCNKIGHIFAWAGLIMVIQQIMVVFIQRIFTRAEISIGFGIPFEFDISWFAEELKLYNAMVICLCVSYTFIQQGHVRVDIFYSRVSFQTKKIIDMFGSLFFMVPMAVILWMYSWFFMWRHLITPKVSAADKIELLIRKSKILKWNVETIGFSPNGFSAYFLFKILIIALVALIFIQAISFFWRSFLEWKEGENSENKYLELEKFDEFSNVSEK